MQNINALKEVIHVDLEPGVITNDMIIQSYQNELQGEAGRLRDLDELNYESIELLRLDFKNILRIDHLWIMPNLTKLSLNFNKLEKIENIDMLVNLKELDLSFNFIERIHNLHTLINLEVLSLANNIITKVENLDTLERLMILSIANNKIDTKVGLERFRFSNSLKVLNLEGNPISADSDSFRIYISGLLPNLDYYNYIYIKNEEREEAKTLFARELREIITQQEDEVNARIKQERDEEQRLRLEKTFVQFLSDNKLYETIVNQIPLFNLLRQVGHGAEFLIYTYRTDFIRYSEAIFNYGLECFELRKAELDLFEQRFQEGQRRVQLAGQNHVNNLNDVKDDKLIITRKLYTDMEKQRMQGIDIDADGDDPNDLIDIQINDFHLHIDELWETLLRDEVHLSETVMEKLKELEINVTDMVEAFIIEMTERFQKLYAVAKTFSSKLPVMFKEYAETSEDILPELWTIVKNDDTVKAYINLINKFNTEAIMACTDQIENAARTWTVEYFEDREWYNHYKTLKIVWGKNIMSFFSAELKRNRKKIIEINYFLDQMRDVFQVQYTEIQDELLNEEEN